MAQPLPKEIRIAKRARAWSLRQRGWTETRIAVELEVNQSTVSRWLDQLTRRALSQLDDRVNRDYLATLGLLDHAIDEAVQAWDRSKKPKRKASKKTGPSADGSTPGDGVTTVETTEREGDPAFWSLALSATDRKAALLALHDRFAPAKDAGPSAGTVLDALAGAEDRDRAYDPAHDPAHDAAPTPTAEDLDA